MVEGAAGGALAGASMTQMREGRNIHGSLSSRCVSRDLYWLRSSAGSGGVKDSGSVPSHTTSSSSGTGARAAFLALGGMAVTWRRREVAMALAQVLEESRAG